MPWCSTPYSTLLVTWSVNIEWPLCTIYPICLPNITPYGPILYLVPINFDLLYPFTIPYGTPKPPEKMGI